MKPANVMLHRDGSILVSDFGIAHMVGAGTPAYMSPEQIKGVNSTPKSEIYALLFRMAPNPRNH